ncbi:Gfo/Idh/MocA family oxidoreductase [Thalassococcus sp. CAU 1522]|uniref:Gfo/Idh/MocA family oxidoreductase n=1 Tax=Thalassococcus arenae TaxID=2851652 RepID=A0ABS6N732_9RHOB|nr:Gfo/Idh/MocA family oxidoreductase [Thalassococcus arenae]MBV2359477.1 Gfo/Idh/MocA family oxidoreductase [Thalassococcus arenae]
MIRVAILGGGIGEQHLAAYRALPDFAVALIVDQDEARRNRLCSDEIAGASSIETALDSDVDLIDICLPPHLHAQTAITALQAGKHVICEKPLATSLDDVDQIAAAADKAARRVFPVFQYRFGPAFAQLQALRDAGLTGGPRVAALETHWCRKAEYYAVPWRGTWAGEQGGAILGHAIHAHDLLCHYFSPIRTISGALTTLCNPIETEDCAALTFALDGGALATSSITLGAARDETRLRLVYENLTATSATTPYAPGSGAWTFTARDPADQPAIDACIAAAPRQAPGFAGFLAEVAKALSGRPAADVTLQDGRRSIELVTAIYEAARTGGTVALPLSADHPMRHGWQP